MNFHPHLAALIDLALCEDIGPGDLTAEALYRPDERSACRIVAKQDMVLSGIETAEAVFARLSSKYRFTTSKKNGQTIRNGEILATLEAPVRCILSGERIAVNFLQHLSGIATLTHKYVGILKNTHCVLLDTRKTAPGYRMLEKAAVRHGGGSNHRMGLFDGVMIKDNHIAATGSITKAVKQVRKKIPPTIKIEVETTNLKQVHQALDAGADIIMFDNMSVEAMTQAVKLVNHAALTEASGGINLGTLRAIAETGVDFISTGAITHSAQAVDVSLEMVTK